MVNHCETFTLDKLFNILFSAADFKQICLQNISEYLHLSNLFTNIVNKTLIFLLSLYFGS